MLGFYLVMKGLRTISFHIDGYIMAAADIDMEVAWKTHTHMPSPAIQPGIFPSGDMVINLVIVVVPVGMLLSTPVSRRPGGRPRIPETPMVKIVTEVTA